MTPIEEPGAGFKATAEVRRKRAEEVLVRHAPVGEEAAPVVPRPVVEIVSTAVPVTSRPVADAVPEVTVAPNEQTVQGMTVTKVVPVIKSAPTFVLERLEISTAKELADLEEAVLAVPLVIPVEP